MSKTSSFAMIVDLWESFLTGSSQRFIRLKNLETGQWIYRGADPNKTSIFSLADIKRTHGNIAEWLDDIILTENLGMFQVHLKKKRGTGTEPGAIVNEYDASYRIKMLKGEVSPTKMETSQAPPKTTVRDRSGFGPETTEGSDGRNGHAAPFIMPSPAPAFSPPHGMGAATMVGMGGAAATAQAAGMGMPEFIELKKNADRAEEFKQRVTKLEEENHTLVLRNRTLESEAASHEKEKNLAVLTEAANKKGFWDSPAAQKIMETAPAILEMMATRANGAQPTGLGSPSDLSAAKQELVGYLADTSITDEMAYDLALTMYHLATNEGFHLALKTLNQKYGDGKS